MDRPWVVNLANRNGIRDADLGFAVGCGGKERNAHQTLLYNIKIILLLLPQGVDRSSPVKFNWKTFPNSDDTSLSIYINNTNPKIIYLLAPRLLAMDKNDLVKGRAMQRGDNYDQAGQLVSVWLFKLLMTFPFPSSASSPMLKKPGVCAEQLLLGLSCSGKV